VLVVGPAVALSLAAPRLTSVSRASGPLEQDPPSQIDVTVNEKTPTRSVAPTRPLGTPLFPAVRWADGVSRGLPSAGSLSGGTQLPLEGEGWVTWNPVADSVPNHPNRLYGNDRIVRKVLAAVAAYRETYPKAPRVVIGDISFRGGGPMELHVSHQNGLDVDVYYPRRDETLRAPTRVDQVDRRLAQGLLDAFLAVGVGKVFVGYRTGLSGPGGVVEPYPNHEDHMHVRFRPPVDR
jgi:murein endopeptidase